MQDAEDLAQEAMLHGWRSYASGARRPSRTWLYRIATNAFLSSIRRRRHLPSDLGPPATDVSLDTVLDEDSAWLEPLPDALVSSDADPASLVIERDRLRLALTASLQHLPARQRSALLLREAVDFSAAEIGDALDISVAAVKSLLQRARATLETIDEAPHEADEPTANRLLESYMRAFETADIRLLERTLRGDAMPGGERGVLGTWRRASGRISAIVGRILAANSAASRPRLGDHGSGGPMTGRYARR